MEISKKNQIVGGLGPKFGPNYGQCCEKVKKQAILSFFSYFTWGMLFKKQKEVVLKPPEWKFMAIIARNAKF